MSMHRIQPVDHSRGGGGFHRLYREAAKTALTEVRSRHGELCETWQQLDQPGGEHLLGKYVRMQEAFIVLAATAEIYCAMATEALLNFYGAIRLGEAFYVRNLERVSAVPKLELLVAMCDGVVLSGDSEIVAVLRRLSETRNRLVHPKSREWRLDRIPPATWADEVPRRIAAAVDDMERFFELFSAISENTQGAVGFFDSSLRSGS